MKDYILIDHLFYQFILPKESGIDAAKRRHDELARKKYHKPFKSFKFNHARRQRP